MNGPPTSGQTADGVVAVSTAKGLAEALTNPNTRRIHLEAGTYDLTELSAGVSFKGNELHLVGSPTDVTKIILFGGHDSRAVGQLSAGRLAIHTVKLTVEKIRFEVVQPPLQEDFFGFGGLPSHPVGLAMHSAAQVRLTDCVFTNKHSAEEEPVTVSITSAAEAKPVHVVIDRCVFGHSRNGGQGGVALGPASGTCEIDDSGLGRTGRRFRYCLRRTTSASRLFPRQK